LEKQAQQTNIVVYSFVYYLYTFLAHFIAIALQQANGQSCPPKNLLEKAVNATQFNLFFVVKMGLMLFFGVLRSPNFKA
jgi:hypothetical protein